MSVDQGVGRGRDGSDEVAGGLVQVVRDGLPLERLAGAGYTPLVFESVMLQLVGYPHEGWSLRALARSARVPYSAVRHICRDLVELGHVSVEEGALRGPRRFIGIVCRPRGWPIGAVRWWCTTG